MEWNWQIKLLNINRQSGEFQPGDKVMVFLPVPAEPLQAIFNGPNKVIEKLGPVDYLIAIPDRRKWN